MGKKPKLIAWASQAGESQEGEGGDVDAKNKKTC